MRRVRSPGDGMCSWCDEPVAWTCRLCGQVVCEKHKHEPGDKGHKPELYSIPKENVED